MGSNYYNFRMATVGGFNKRDVINYIEKMRNEFYAYKKSVEDTVEQLNAKIRELEAMNGEAVQVAEAPIEVSSEPFKQNDCLADINEAASQLKTVAEELCKNLSNFMSKVNPEPCRKEAEKEAEVIVEAEIEKETYEFDPIFSKTSSFWFNKDEKCNVEKSENMDEAVIEGESEKTDKASDDENSLFALLGQKSFFC